MNGEIIIYQTEDGLAEVGLWAEDHTVWLTQAELAELFDTAPQAITQLIKVIYEDSELKEDSTCKNSLQVRQEGTRQVQRNLKVYNLEVILAVGYRVRSPRGTQFRQWATRHLAEYLVKGFVLNDKRLKEPGGWDYFDELLERIREIRASEKRFYQKVRDLFALSLDYKNNLRQSQIFFAEVQNKLLFAVTGKTAAEIVVERSDPKSPNMNLTSWKGAKVREGDVIIAKNYLNQDEIDSLNRLVVIFLETAELRVRDRKQLSLDYWRNNVDRMLEFSEHPVLQGAGSISHQTAERIAHQRYSEFDKERKKEEAHQAEQEDLKELECMEKQFKKTRY